MTREEFIETYNIEDGCVFLEPWEDFKDGIVGITENHCQVIYSYQGMVECLARSYEKEYWKEHKNENYDEDRFSEFLDEAAEWIDYNTLRSLPYIDSNFRPIVMFEIEDKKDLANYQSNSPTIKEVQKKNAELKQEMKNRISLALKDPILQQGFEIICKQLVELEKDLVELKKRNGVLAGQKASLGRWLGEAIAVIKKFSEFLNDKVEHDPEHSQEHTDLWNELCERAERFLKDFMPPEV